ncbi:alpha-1,4-glucan--maltose-1-phosphate maltosyltransferase [Thioalkalivibrio sp.]|uniref:alpha-1,4-glucan--maltose-1-phosphate maltosyltransferase n=1 Tax=Thioalkalivibrio sp. TaxID=2093813 RepID=UPI0025D7FD58|nr:alpha-1,4-glucan--maltose-1-phosphate maltosyltransferase [Thioalkalivibrio sp.]
MARIFPEEGRQRVMIEAVSPQVDGGRFPIKRTVGESVVVEARAFADGHDRLRCLLRHRREDGALWHETPMLPMINDRWRAEFTVPDLGRYLYTVTGWVDGFLSWLHDLERRTEPEDIRVALVMGAELVARAGDRAVGDDAETLVRLAEALRSEDDLQTRVAVAMSTELGDLMERYPDRSLASVDERELVVTVEPERARFSAWYEVFPRSCSMTPGVHGTFRDCEKWLPYIAGMGFDVLYLPPIHPIGRSRRKGPNNALTADADDPGSPWAIGSAEGGHLSVHPELGTLEDFRSLVAGARDHGLEVALDIAFQCAPDHPYVAEHPAWFRHRPDGSVQYAENPPKKYQDIYPFDFETADWQGLWTELEGIFRFWIEQGVQIFRVDNPHTKSFAFWEWVIAEIKRDFPGTIFLAEAFARPAVLHGLAKRGFSQSYNYFPWRNTKQELTAYFTELTRGEGREYLRPNLWPATPDILPEYLQFGGRPAFMIRATLAATLGASYGIYGPAFELIENRPRWPGTEEYLDSEKYQIRHWDLRRPDSLRDYLARLNRIRRENPALQYDGNLRFHVVDNDEILCFSKRTDDGVNVVLVVVNLDPVHVQSGYVQLPVEEFGLDPGHPYQVHDLLSNSRHLWHGTRNYVALDPQAGPAHIFRLRRRLRSEHDFDYYL